MLCRITMWLSNALKMYIDIQTKKPKRVLFIDVLQGKKLKEYDFSMSNFLASTEIYIQQLLFFLKNYVPRECCTRHKQSYD